MLSYRYYTDNKRICSVAEDILEVGARNYNKQESLNFCCYENLTLSRSKFNICREQRMKKYRIFAPSKRQRDAYCDRLKDSCDRLGYQA
jgi:hypothetical protein